MNFLSDGEVGECRQEKAKGEMETTGTRIAGIPSIVWWRLAGLR